MHIHIISNWGNFPIIRQTLDSDLENHQITYGEDAEDCDVLVVLDNLVAHRSIQTVTTKACILFLLETPSIFKPRRRYTDQFEYVYTYRNDMRSKNAILVPACAPWHIGVSRKTMNGNIIHESRMGLKEIRDLQLARKFDRISMFSTTKKITWLHRKRAEFERQILVNSAGLQIDLFGGGQRFVTDKLEGLLPYKYSIAVENSIHDGYFSEKLTDAVLSGCHVFYHGCPKAQDTFPGALTMIDICSPEAAIKTIIDSVRSDAYAKSIGDINNARVYILSHLNLMSAIVRASCRIPEIARRKHRIYLLRSNAECRRRRMLKSALRW